MRLKPNFGKGGLKGFVSQHAEKAIFGLVLGLVAFFIYSSATQEVEETGSPEDLKRNASSASSGLSQDYWDAIRPEREKEVEDYGEKAQDGRKPIDQADYALAHIWDPPVTPKRGHRDDPRILAPEQVEALGGVFNIPVRSAGDDPWEGDKDAVAKPKEEAKPKRTRRKKSTRRTSSEGGDEAMLMGGSGAYFQDASEGDGMGPGYMDSSGMGDEGAMGPGAMTTSGMTGGRRTIGKTYRQLYIKGYQGTFGQMGRGALGRSFAVVGVTAIVPYEKQWEEYERALAGTTGYSAKQDIPRYLFFLAEKAEVPADPDAPLDWKPVSNSKYAMKISARYAAFPKEVADQEYTVPNVLTMPIPPIMLKSYEFMSRHRDIPRQQVKVQQVASTEEASDEEEPIELGPSGSELTPDDFAIPKVNPGATGGGGMYGVGSGGGSGMYAPGGAGGMMGPDEDFSSMEGGSGMDYDETGGDMYGGSGAGYGSGGDYGASFGAAQEQTVVKYKMVRFFDLTAEPGKSYRYRVAVVLEDPNHPENPQAAPNTRHLDPAVAKRVQEVEAKDAETSSRTGEPTRTFYRQTEWSEPSNVVTVAEPEKFVAGGATHGKVIPLGDGIEIQTTESKGKLVTMVWDEARAAEIPAEKEVFRGSFLSFAQDADALHPLTQQIKTIEGFDFKTDAFVADLRGGRKLITDIDEENDNEETIHYTPAEFLVIDGEGNLLACNEIDDTEEFRRLTFAEDTAQPVAATGGSGMPGGDYGDMMDYGDMGSGMDMMEGGGSEEY